MSLPHKSHSFLLKKEEPGHSDHLNKVKPNSDTAKEFSVQCVRLTQGKLGVLCVDGCLTLVILHFPVSHLHQIFASRHLIGTLDLALKSIFVKKFLLLMLDIIT